jgi:hypothetical protein
MTDAARALAIALACAGCGGSGESGLVLVFADGAEAAGGEAITTLELFVGRAATDQRYSRDYDPARDTFAVGTAQLDGYRLFLRAEQVPVDLKAVAVIGYAGDPAAGAPPVIFGVVENPPFTGELTEVTLRFEPLEERGQAGPDERWLDRWGAAPLEAVADHACIAWGTGAGGAAVTGQIVRLDDRDCDGTVPPTCDDLQRDRTLLEGEPDVDGDGYGQWSDDECRACLVQVAENEPLVPVECDCDEGDASVHFAAAELCDALDTDCDGALDGDQVDQRAVPCQLAVGGGPDCTMGVAACTESTGTVVETGCVALPVSHVSCVDLSDCETPARCPIGDATQPQNLVAFHCLQREAGGAAGEICGEGPIAQFFPAIGAGVPTVCSATVWNGDSNGWKVVLTDGTGRESSYVGAPCDQLAIVVAESPGADGAHWFGIVVIGDSAGAPIAALPIDIALDVTDDACEPSDALQCAAPVPPE